MWTYLLVIKIIQKLHFQFSHREKPGQAHLQQTVLSEPAKTLNVLMSIFWTNMDTAEWFCIYENLVYLEA